MNVYLWRSHRMTTNQESLVVSWGTAGTPWFCGNDAFALKPCLNPESSYNEGYIYIDLSQHVSCRFLKRIFHLCKQKDSRNKTLRTGKKTCGRWKYYILTRDSQSGTCRDSGRIGEQSASALRESQLHHWLRSRRSAERGFEYSITT